MLWQNTTQEFDKFKFEPDNGFVSIVQSVASTIILPILTCVVLYPGNRVYVQKNIYPKLIFCCNVRAGPDLCSTSSIIVHIQEISMALKESVPMLNKGKMHLI